MYQTIAAPAEDEFVQQKSRFLGAIIPVQTEEEALAFIEAKRKQHWDATHNVYAYIIRAKEGLPEIKRCSDDGEPQGTAGRPALEVLEREELTDVALVCTRYFGGILLGAGGLVRAYAHTAKIAVDAATRLHMAPCLDFTLTLDYGSYGSVSYLLPQYKIETRDSRFEDKVILSLRIRADRMELFTKALTELSNGKLAPQVTQELFADMP